MIIKNFEVTAYAKGINHLRNESFRNRNNTRKCIINKLRKE